MSRIEGIGNTGAQGRAAKLNEARRALLDLARRSVVLGSQAGDLDLREQVAMASDAHACLDEAARASLAGRLFVVDHATLLDDLDPYRRRHDRARCSAAVRSNADLHAGV